MADIIEIVLTFSSSSFHDPSESDPTSSSGSSTEYSSSDPFFFISAMVTLKDCKYGFEKIQAHPKDATRTSFMSQIQ